MNQAVEGSDLFARMLEFKHGDTERDDLMRKVWTPTPFMVDFRTGSPDDEGYRAILQWCYENIGPQAYPIHGREGDWQTGSATIHGWTWIGFRTQELLDGFLSAFGRPTTLRAP